MAKIERNEDQELLEQMKALREVLKKVGGKELISDADWLAGGSSHRETSEEGGADQVGVNSVDQFVIKKRGQK